MNKFFNRENLIKLTQRSDLVIAMFLMCIIFMMIMPLPTALVDTLIATNMGVAVILLMLAVYIGSPLEFVGFPSVLLLTTLMRLALSISTTRLILLNGDAGKIVDAFGNFVVGGNLIVGMVIFLIITIVQFLVITKGSERVAEVSARFSLDGMPGKQMSIDGDMRAGVIDMEQARQRRALVEKESQLYGAMDGAMKFVKGDAIAGLVIILVNLIGGISIGVFQNDLSAADALHKYAILTIGDGLIAQIPALFISITAGIIVTRVTTEESQDLGRDLTNQIMNKPNALLTGSGLLMLFAMMPNFPAMTFLGLGTAVGGLGYIALRRKRQKEALGGGDSSLSASGKRPDAAGLGASNDTPFAVPLMVELDKSLEAFVQSTALNQELSDIRSVLLQELGIPFPGIHAHFVNNLGYGKYSLLINETPMVQAMVLPEHILVRCREDDLKIFEIPFEEAASLELGAPAYWVSAEWLPTLEKAGMSFLKPAQVIAFHLANILRKNASEFIGIQETRQLLEKMEKSHGELVKEVQRIMPIQKIAEILQRLVSENISVRNLRSILESLVEWGHKEKDVVQLAEYIRSGQKRYISHKFSNGQNLLSAYLLDEDTEEAIRNGIRMTSAGAYLALEPNVSQKFLRNIKAAVGNVHDLPQTPVLITSMDIRRYVRKLIELDLYELPVLSFQELTQEITIQPISRVGMS